MDVDRCVRCLPSALSSSYGPSNSIPFARILSFPKTLARKYRGRERDWRITVGNKTPRPVFCQHFSSVQMIAKKRNKDWERVQRLIDVQERLAFNLDEMITVVMTELHEEPYTLDEVYIVVRDGLAFFSCVSRDEANESPRRSLSERSRENGRTLRERG